MSEEKVKISIHLLRRAYETALARSAATGTPLSVTVADAAARMLLALNTVRKMVTQRQRRFNTILTCAFAPDMFYCQP